LPIISSYHKALRLLSSTPSPRCLISTSFAHAYFVGLCLTTYPSKRSRAMPSEIFYSSATRYLQLSCLQRARSAVGSIALSTTFKELSRSFLLQHSDSSTPALTCERRAIVLRFLVWSYTSSILEARYGSSYLVYHITTNRIPATTSQRRLPRSYTSTTSKTASDTSQQITRAITIRV
jgi:hypothetical protein